MNLVPNIPAKNFTLSAFIIGYILIDELTPAEQNSLGNWFMLIGQTLSTNSAQQQVINNRNNMSNRSNRHVVNDSLGEDYENTSFNPNSLQQQIYMLEKTISVMQQEINRLKTQ